MAAQRLRFEVFNVELKEGLDAAWESGIDEDQFDAVCDHLIVEETRTGRVVGTYRLQTGGQAAKNLGFYSEQEFDFTPYLSVRDQMVELGRACVHQDHRKMSVVNMLWRGIAEYARERNAHYMIGCSSVTSQDPGVAWGTYEQLSNHLAEEAFRTQPCAAYQTPYSPPPANCPKPPRLLRAYLSVGAKICSPPALDREFKTIDFLTLLDLRSLPVAVHNHYVA